MLAGAFAKKGARALPMAATSTGSPPIHLADPAGAVQAFGPWGHYLRRTSTKNIPRKESTRGHGTRRRLPEANPVSAEARGKAREFIRRATAEDDLRFALLTGFSRNIQQRMDRHPGSRIRSDKLKDIIHRWEVGSHQFRLRFEVEWKGKFSAIEITASGNAALSGVTDWVADATELVLMINTAALKVIGEALTSLTSGRSASRSTQ